MATKNKNLTKYEITYLVNDKKKKVVANGYDEKQGIIRSMKRGGYSESYTNISVKKIK